MCAMLLSLRSECGRWKVFLFKLQQQELSFIHNTRQTQARHFQCVCSTFPQTLIGSHLLAVLPASIINFQHSTAIQQRAFAPESFSLCVADIIGIQFFSSHRTVLRRDSVKDVLWQSKYLFLMHITLTWLTFCGRSSILCLFCRAKSSRSQHHAKQPKVISRFTQILSS